MKLSDSPHHGDSRGNDTNLNGHPDTQDSALETAEDQREDLEALTASARPFAYDAQQILSPLEKANRDEGDTQ